MKYNVRVDISSSGNRKLLQYLCGLMLAIIMMQHPAFAQQEIQPQQIRAVSWGNYENKLAVGYQDGRIEILDLSGQNDPIVLQGDTSLILSLAWSPDDRYLASGSTWPDDTLRIWDAQTGVQMFERSGFGDDILTVAWSPDGNQVIAVTAEGETASGNAIAVNPRTEEVTQLSLGVVTDISWSVDGTKLAIATISGVTVRDSLTFEVLFDVQVDREIVRPHLQHQLVTVAWSQDGRLVAGGMGDGQIYVWSLSASEPIITLFGNDYAGEDRFLGWIHDLRFDESGKYLSSISGDGTMRSWDIQQGSLTFETVISPSYASAFSPYGARIALGLPVDAIEALPVPEDTSPHIQRFLDSALQIAPVNLTAESLQSLADTCNLPPDTMELFAASGSGTQLSDVINTLQGLPEDTIPPACVADLIAGAITLQR